MYSATCRNLLRMACWLLVCAPSLLLAQLTGGDYPDTRYQDANAQLDPANPAGIPAGPTNAGQQASPFGRPVLHPVEQATFEALPNGTQPPNATPRPLAPRGPVRALPKQGEKTEIERPPSSAPSSLTVIGSLVFVLVVFFGVAWVMKRGMPSKLAGLPTDVVEVLGRTTLASRNQMHLIRVGGKLLLVSVTAAGAETLTEITDPAEVDRLTSICGQTKTDSISATFQNGFRQVSREAEQGASQEDLLTESSPKPKRFSLFGRGKGGDHA